MFFCFPLPGCENTTTVGCNARKANKTTTVHDIVAMEILRLRGYNILKFGPDSL
jgi:hypothetical protein